MATLKCLIATLCLLLMVAIELSYAIEFPLDAQDGKSCTVEWKRPPLPVVVTVLQENGEIETLQSCLARCLSNANANQCNAFALDRQSSSCLLLREQDPNAAGLHDPYTSNYFAIKECREAEGNLIATQSILTADVALPILQEKCKVVVLEGTTVKGLGYANVAYDTETAAMCLTQCKMSFDESCVGAYYSTAEKWCKLLHVKTANNLGYEILPGQQVMLIDQCEDSEPEREREQVAPVSGESFEQTQFDEYNLPTLRKFCLVKVKRPGSTQHYRLEQEEQDIASMENCILKCNLLMLEKKCDAVHYSIISGVCSIYIKSEQHTIEVVEGGRFVEIVGCSEDEGDQPTVPQQLLPGNLNYAYQAEMDLEESGQKCTLLIMPPGEKIGMKEIGKHNTDTAPSCVAKCLAEKQSQCNTIQYSEEEKMCILYQYDPAYIIDVPWGTIFAEILKCEPVGEEAQGDTGGHPVDSLQTSSVEHQGGAHAMESFFFGDAADADLSEVIYIQQMDELCSTKVYNEGQRVAGFDELDSYRQVADQETCVFLCRNYYLATCSALDYDEEKKSCKVFKKNPNGELKISPSSSLMELKSCERVDHPFGLDKQLPVNVFLEAFEEVCRIIGYGKGDQLESWDYAREGVFKVTSMIDCLELCRMRNDCKGVLLRAGGNCQLVKPAHSDKSVPMGDQEIFLRIMHCQQGAALDVLK